MNKTRKTYSPEEKARYFADIRKNDPKRLCDKCNRMAVVWKPAQACSFHAANPDLAKGQKRQGPGARETIDMLVRMLMRTVLVIPPKANKDFLKELLALVKAVRPDGLPEEKEEA